MGNPFKNQDIFGSLNSRINQLDEQVRDAKEFEVPARSNWLGTDNADTSIIRLPTINDNRALGYGVGSFWKYQLLPADDPRIFVCTAIDIGTSDATWTELGTGAGTASDHLVIEITETGGVADLDNPTRAELLAAISATEALIAQPPGTHYYFNRPNGTGTAQWPDWVYLKDSNGGFTRVESLFNMVTGSGLDGAGSVSSPLVANNNHREITGTFADADNPTHFELVTAIAGMSDRKDGDTYYYNLPSNPDASVDRPDYVYKQTTGGAVFRTEARFNLVTGDGLSGSGTAADPLVATGSATYTQITGTFADPDNPTLTELITAVIALPNRSSGERFYYLLPSSGATLNNPDYIFFQTVNGDIIREEARFNLVTGNGLSGSGTPADPLVADASANYTLITGTFADPNNPTSAELQAGVLAIAGRFAGDRFYYNRPLGSGTPERPDYVFFQSSTGTIARIETPFYLTIGDGLSGSGTPADPLIATGAAKLTAISSAGMSDPDNPTSAEIITNILNLVGRKPGDRFYYNRPSGAGTVNRPDYVYFQDNTGIISRLEAPFYITTDATLDGDGSPGDPLRVVGGGGGTTAHQLTGPLHTETGLTAGHVLTATGPTTFTWVAPNTSGVTIHSITGPEHTESGLTAGHVLTATGPTTFAWQAPAALASHRITGSEHTETGLTAGHVLTATGPTTFAWVAPNTSGVTVHRITGPEHTETGLTAGHVLTATGPTTFAWQALTTTVGTTSNSQDSGQLGVPLASAVGTGQLNIPLLGINKGAGNTAAYQLDVQADVDNGIIGAFRRPTGARVFEVRTRSTGDGLIQVLSATGTTEVQVYTVGQNGRVVIFGSAGVHHILAADTQSYHRSHVTAGTSADIIQFRNASNAAVVDISHTAAEHGFVDVKNSAATSVFSRIGGAAAQTYFKSFTASTTTPAFQWLQNSGSSVGSVYNDGRMKVGGNYTAQGTLYNFAYSRRSMFMNLSGTSYDMHNAYYDGSTWRRVDSAASFMNARSSGGYFFYSAVSGSANGSLTWRIPFSIGTNAELRMPLLPTAKPAGAGQLWNNNGYVAIGDFTGTFGFGSWNVVGLDAQITGANGGFTQGTSRPWGPVRYRLGNGFVQITGCATISTTTQGLSNGAYKVFTLPVGSRPQYTMSFVSTIFGDPDAGQNPSSYRNIGVITINPDGEVFIITGGWSDLTDVIFNVFVAVT